MAKTPKKSNRNVVVYVACFLFCLTLISIRLTSDLYAKYTAYASAGDSARVAAFGTLTLTGPADYDAAGKIIPGVNLADRVQVSFTGSEAATYVFVDVTPTGGWIMSDDHMAFSLKSGTKVLVRWSVAADWTYLKSTDAGAVYYRALPPNTPLNNVDVLADEGTITVSELITKSELAALPDVLSIRVRATVVQAGGFASPEAAWDSVSAKEGGT